MKKKKMLEYKFGTFQRISSTVPADAVMT